MADEGGNTFTLELSDEPPRRRGIRKKKFHGFWDYDAVNALFSQVPGTLRKKELEAQIEPLKKDLIHDMATREPSNWQMPTNVSVDSYAEMWANEILPIAREAHARLEFRNVKPFLDGDRIVAAGEAIEKPAPDHTPYRDGQPASCGMSYTRPGGVWPICWTKSSNTACEQLFSE